MDIEARAAHLDRLLETAQAAVAFFSVERWTPHEYVKAAANIQSDLMQSIAAAHEAVPAVLQMLDVAEQERDELRNLVAELWDDEACRYDHHDYCQTHNLHKRPCPHERAAQIPGIR